MNSDKFISGLAALNVGLLVAVGWLWHLLQTRPPVVRIVTPPRVVTNTLRRVALQNVMVPAAPAPPAKPLQWRDLEASDYTGYIHNLRSIGCPEEIIQDIILADMAKVYAQKRAALRAAASQRKYWQTEAPGSSQPPVNAEFRKQWRELVLEQRALAKDLLEVDLDTALAKFLVAEPDPETILDFLPPAKQAQIEEALARYQAREQEIYERTRGIFVAEDAAQLARIGRERQAELAELLTPEQLEEYHLRNSDTAKRLRYELSGFSPTEEEYRNLFKLQAGFEAKFGPAPAEGSPAASERSAEEREAAERQLAGEIKNLLGARRYAEYERAKDPDYKTLLQLGDRFDLPQETLLKVYAIKQMVADELDKLELNPALTAEQRQQLLTAMREETERSVNRLLGDKAGTVYQQYGGQWMLQFNRMEAELKQPASATPATPTPEMLLHHFPLPPLPPPLPAPLPPPG